ncbi:MAG TPA: hypothetical protein VNT53_10205 [Pseudolysinimonas sp.]|nr:hypothetical protein [Pseudolysinimonas sp.]
MNALTPIGFAAALLATAAVLTLTRPIRGKWMSWPAVALGVASCVVTVGGGALAGLPLAFPLGLGFWAIPTSVALASASAALGFSGRFAWAPMTGWALLVFPSTALVTMAVASGCGEASCRIDDFGGALPLAFTAVAFLLVSRSAGIRMPSDPWTAHPTANRPIVQILAVLALWVAFILWLAHLEGVVDAYFPRILAGAVIGPLCAAIGWTVVDLLRGHRRPVIRSMMFGLLVGMPATLAGVATVGSPWGEIAAVAAGAVGALVLSIRPHKWLAVRRATAAVGAATLMGFLASPIAGDMTGVLFTGNASGLAPPLFAVLVVIAWSVLVAWVSWATARFAAR